MQLLATIKSKTQKFDDSLKNKYRSVTLRMTILFAIILIVEFSFAKIFPDWEIRSNSLILINTIIFYLSFFGFIFCLILLFKPVFEVRVIIEILFVILVGLSTWLTMYPIDTTTHPVDLQTIETYSDGKKLVIRHFKNAKTNAEIQDTVLVKDVFLFRRLFRQEN